MLRSQWAYFPHIHFRFCRAGRRLLWGFRLRRDVRVVRCDRYAEPRAKVVASRAAARDRSRDGICAGLAFLMYTQLPEWCPLCAATHIITALLFVVTALLWPRPGDTTSPSFQCQ